MWNTLTNKGISALTICLTTMRLLAIIGVGGPVRYKGRHCLDTSADRELSTKMPASMVTAILQGCTIGHSTRLNKLNRLIKLKSRSTRMEPGYIAITDGAAEAGLHFSVQSEFSVQLFVLHHYDDNYSSAHEFIHIADIKGGLIAFIFSLPAYESQACGSIIVN